MKLLIADCAGWRLDPILKALVSRPLKQVNLSGKVKESEMWKEIWRFRKAFVVKPDVQFPVRVHIQYACTADQLVKVKCVRFVHCIVSESYCCHRLVAEAS